MNAAARAKLAQADALRAQADAIEAEARALDATISASGDGLVSLRRCGLPAKSARALIRAGRLRAAVIGRETFVARGDVARLFDELAAEQTAERDAKERQPEPASAYASIVNLARKGRAA